jgi:hypothetical protein
MAGWFDAIAKNFNLDAMGKNVAEKVGPPVADVIKRAVDSYFNEKLTEIESRIDAKLKLIDERVNSYLTRFIVVRLQLVKWSLIAAVSVALISLAYKSLVP